MGKRDERYTLKNMVELDEGFFTTEVPDDEKGKPLKKRPWQPAEDEGPGDGRDRGGQPDEEEPQAHGRQAHQDDRHRRPLFRDHRRQSKRQY